MGGDGVSMSRYFIEQQAEIGATVLVEGDTFHHLKNVLRKRLGERITLFDGKGYTYDAIIERIYKDCLEAIVEHKTRALHESPTEIILFQGMPKWDKMEYIIQKAVELGVASIVPVITKRCVVRVDGEMALKKQKRWQKIALEASQQSERGIIPNLHTPTSFEEALQMANHTDLQILAYEKEANQTMKQLLKMDLIPKSVAIFIGPEGGFEEEEVSSAVTHGVKSISLGPRILRTETAGLIVSALVQHHWGDI